MDNTLAQGCGDSWSGVCDPRERRNKRRECHPICTTKPLSIIPYIQPQYNVNAVTYSYMYTSIVTPFTITSVPNTDPTLGYIQITANAAASFGFDQRPPQKGDPVVIANFVADPAVMPYVNFMPPAVQHALYAIVSTPTPASPFYMLEPWNVAADPINGWRVGDMVYSEFGSASGGKSIAQIGTVGGSPANVYLAEGYVQGLLRIDNMLSGCKPHKNQCGPKVKGHFGTYDCSSSSSSCSSSSSSSCSEDSSSDFEDSCSSEEWCEDDSTSYSEESSSCSSESSDCSSEHKRKRCPKPIRIPPPVPRNPLPRVYFDSSCDSSESDSSRSNRNRRGRGRREGGRGGR